MPAFAAATFFCRNGSSAARDVLGGPCLPDGFAHCLRRLRVQRALVLQPLRALRRLHVQQLGRVHPHPRRSQADPLAREALDVVAHQRLVDAADLLDVQRLVAQPLPFKDEELVEHQVDGLVVHGGHSHPRAREHVHGSAAVRPPFQEGVGLWIEQLAAAGRNLAVAVVRAEEDRAEQRQQPVPRAEPAAHRVRVAARVPLELRVERLDGQVLAVGLRAHRQEGPVLGVQQEDQPQEDGEQAAVDVVRAARERVLQVARLVPLRGRLEAGEEDLQRLVDLASERLGDGGLAPPRLLQQRGQRVLLRHGEEPPRVEQHEERVEQRPAAGRDEVAQPERQVAGGLAVGRVDQPELLAVGEQPDGHAARAQEAVELGLGRVAPGAGHGLLVVEREPLRQRPDEHEVGLAGSALGRAVVRQPIGGRGARLLPPERARGADRLMALDDLQRQLLRERLAAVEVVGRVAEDVLVEAGVVGDAGRSVIGLDQLGQPGLLLGAVPVHALGVGEDDHRHDEPLVGLGHAEPRLVKALLEVAHRARAYLSGGGLTLEWPPWYPRTMGASRGAWQGSRWGRRRVTALSVGIGAMLVAAGCATNQTAERQEAAALVTSYNLGLRHQLRGRQREAREWFLRAAQASPEDWRTRAKLVQVTQALGQHQERERHRAALLALYRAGKVDSPEFCREQFREGPHSVVVFESFELAGPWATRYRFDVEGAPGRPARRLTLGAYAVTTALARLHGEVGSKEPLFHLDGYEPGRQQHETYDFYTREPAYEEARARVIAILREQTAPLSGSRSPGPALPAWRGRAAGWPGKPRIQRVALSIDGRHGPSYVETTFAELQQLAPSALLGPDERVHVLGPVDEGHAGTWLVATLARAAKHVVITYTPYYNKAVAQNWHDASNGKGSDAFVYFNRSYDPAIPTVRADGRVVGKRGGPSYIGLGHELIHALHMIRGTLVGTTSADVPGDSNIIARGHWFKNKTGKRVKALEDLEELNTIGIGEHRNGPTENDLRREHGLPRRGAHSLKNTMSDQ